MICSSVYLLFFMSVILLKDGLHDLHAGTAGGGQVSSTVVSAKVFGRLPELELEFSNSLWLVTFSQYRGQPSWAVTFNQKPKGSVSVENGKLRFE
jgi:hypothetical protein